MMNRVLDSATTVSSCSWRQQMRDATAGIIFGILILVGGVWLLGYNEGRSVRRYRVLHEGEKNCIDIASDDAMLSENNDKLVHFSGKVTASDEGIKDEVFGVTPEKSSDSNGIIKLLRTVSMYQWVETPHIFSTTGKDGREMKKTTYTYEKSFASYAINSDSFYNSTGHKNPKHWQFETASFIADEVYVGKIKMPDDMIGQMNWYKSIGVSKDTIPDESIRNQAKEFGGSLFIVGENGGGPNNPKIGDIRVAFQVVDAGADVSIIAKQHDDTIKPYTIRNKDTIFWLMRGKYSANEIFMQKEAQNELTTKFLRIVGCFIIFIGMRIIIAPLLVISDIIPCLGSFIECASIIISIALTGIVSAFTIAIAWMIHRPILCGSIICIIAGMVHFGVKKVKHHKQEQQQQQINDNGDTNLGVNLLGSVSDNIVDHFSDRVEMSRFSGHVGQI